MYVMTCVLVASTVCHAQLGSTADYFMLGKAEKDQDCSGVAGETCKACVGGESKWCKAITKQCKKSLCLPLCLQHLWNVEIKASGDPELQSAVASQPVQAALRQRFIAYGCADVLGCCQKDSEFMQRWIDRAGFEYSTQVSDIDGMGPDWASFLVPAVPIKFCDHDPEDEEQAKEKCDKCKGKVTSKITMYPCAYAEPPTNLKEQKVPSGRNTQAYKDASLEPKDEKPGHKDFQTRCKKLEKALKAKKSTIEGDHKKVACEILGCCAKK